MFNVLIIEDEPLIAHFISTVIKKKFECGKISIAAHEDDAIDIAVNINPELIISDYTLLGGNGVSAVKKIYEKSLNPKVIFITALPEYIIDLDFECCLVKPVSSRMLVEAVLDIMAPVSKTA